MKSAFILLFAATSLSGAASRRICQQEDSLAVSKTVAVEEVVVTATKASASTPVAFANLSKTELNKANDGQGIPALIALTPSVISTSDAGTGIGYSGFRIRGTDATRINITVNGVPLNDAESQAVFWVNMPDFASSVENIQIQRGAGTSTNGAAAFGATVAMQTQPPAIAPGAEYTLSAGSFGTIRHTVKVGTGLLGNHFALDARYSDVRSDGYIDRAWARMSSWFLSASWYGENTMLRFQTFGSDEKTYQAWNGVPDTLLRKGIRTFNPCGLYYENGRQLFYDNQTDNYRQQHYHLNGSIRLSDEWNTTATLHYTPGAGYYEDYKANAKLSAYKLAPYIAPDSLVNRRSDLVRRKWVASDFYGGIYSLNYRNDMLQATFGAAVNNYAADHYGRVMWVKAANALPAPNYEYYRNEAHKLDYSSFLKATLTLSPALNAYADLQYRGVAYTIKGSDDKAGDNLNVDMEWDFFNPKVGFSYAPGNHSLFASLSVAHREPTRDNYTEAAPTERPTYETLHDWEAGYQYQTAGVALGANFYYMAYDNQLILSGKISEIGEPLTSNIKESYRAGVELTARARIAPWLEWRGTATLSRNKINNFTEYIENYDTGKQDATPLGTTDIAFSPSLSGASIFDFSLARYSATLTSQYVGRQYIDNSSSIERSIAPYFISGLRIGYDFPLRNTKGIAVDVTVNNLFNAKYETNGWAYSYISDGRRMLDSGYFAQAGTHFLCRLTVKI
ncbi:MAG: TonB-dependent receptor plug domain-containing protein [Tannerellaceae bacterium]|jgi:iron complex outermembrane receptor protein|nr:TonB-dependent receptor plug domain-containing protein [Tannerellaceae bacterium]